MSACSTCFVDPVPLVPVQSDNRPGLSAIAYRIGTFTSFRAALLDAISSTPELAGLRARLSDDYSITILELWSLVADILTFYQERIANEGYLRTATLRDSVLRLVRLIDYQLQPGLAATALLAFTLEKNAVVTIPTRLRVQSVPAGTGSPQKYETIESILADARFNSLPILPGPEFVSPLTPGRVSELFAPGADMTAFASSLAPGDRLVAFTPSEIEILTLAGITVEADRVRVQWKVPPSLTKLSGSTDGRTPGAGLFKIGRTFRLFGYDAPDQFIESFLLDPNDPKSLRAKQATSPTLTLGGSTLALDALYSGIKPGSALLLDVVTSAGGNTTETTIYTTVLTVSEARQTFGPKTAVVTVLTAHLPGAPTDPIVSLVIYELIGPQLRLLPEAFPPRLSSTDLYLSGRRNGWSSIEVSRTIVKGVMQPGITLDVNDLTAGREIILLDSDPSTAVSAKIAATDLFGDQISLGLAGTDALTLTQMGLEPDKVQSITALVSPPFDSGLATLHNSRLEMQVTIGQRPPQIISLAPAISVHPGGVSLVSIAAALRKALQAALPDAPEFANAHAAAVDKLYLFVMAGAPGAPVAFAPTATDPDTVVDLGLNAANVRYLDGVSSGPLNLTAPGSGALTVSLETLGQRLVMFTIYSLPSSTVDSLRFGIQTAFVLRDSPIVFYDVASNHMYCFPPPAYFERPCFLHISVEPSAPIDLDSSSAMLLGNVAGASQGESVQNEIVGDGNASAVFQTFTLKKSPVTFLLGDGPHGAQSSLAVSVNGVQWTEVSTLYGTGPNDQVFVTRIADDGTLTMEFGDGVTASRLPTGLANISATYRKGVGLAGRVATNTLTSLLDKANGLKRVTNPIAADGGADPQKLEDARANAPVTVRTFGRAVSLLDFEDVALATGEVAKANATWVWTGLQKAIFLTVAAQNGEKLSPDGIQQLWAALLPHRDPNHILLIDNFIRVPIVMTANLTVDARYSARDVKAAAFTALVAALSFDRLEFGEAIQLSAIYEVLQGVPGVTAVDITDLNLKNQDPEFRKAHGADDRKPQPHLFMLGARPGTTPGVTVLPAELAWVDVPTQDLVLTAAGGSGA